MNYYREFNQTQAFELYKDILTRYIESMEEGQKVALFNELRRDINCEQIHFTSEIDDLFYGLSFTEAYEMIDHDSFDFSDDYMMYDETYGLWRTYCRPEDCTTEYDSEDMASELLNLDISKYTEISDSHILWLIGECEREAGHEIAVREQLAEELRKEEDACLPEPSWWEGEAETEITLRG